MTISSMKASIVGEDTRACREGRRPIVPRAERRSSRARRADRPVARPARSPAGRDPAGLCSRGERAPLRAPSTIPSGPHFEPGRPAPGAEAGDIVLTGADLTVADVEAVARGGARAVLDLARPGTDGGGAGRRRPPRRGRRGRLRDHDRLRRPRHDLHPAGRRPPAPGEPAREPRGRSRPCAPARRRPGDAAPAGEHAGTRAFRVPARRSSTGSSGSWSSASTRSCPAAGERRRVGRPRPAGPPRPAARRARRGRSWAAT